MQNDSNLIWVDMEMTGLDPDVDKVLEIATIVTDSNLNIIAEGPVLAVWQPEEVLAAMGEWCQTHHTQSGLLERVRREGVSLAEAEARTLDFVRQHVPPKTSPLCGNSVSQDRRFLYKYMPTFQDYLHYRTLDVSTIKILGNLWRPSMMANFTKREAHLALDDIRESIAELAFYRQHFFRLS